MKGYKKSTDIIPKNVIHIIEHLKTQTYFNDMRKGSNAVYFDLMSNHIVKI